MSVHIRTIRFPVELDRQMAIAAASQRLSVPAFVQAAVSAWLQTNPNAPADLSVRQAVARKRGVPLPVALNRRLEKAAARLEATAQDCVLEAVRQRVEAERARL